jgi:hypothetical protein
VGLPVIHGREEWNLRNIVTVEKTIGKRRIRFLGFNKVIDGLDILDHGHNATCEHEQACEDGDNANDIQANENV